MNPWSWSSLTAYLAALGNNWFALMSGIAGVILGAVGAYLPEQPRLWFNLAAWVCFIIAPYRAWVDLARRALTEPHVEMEFDGRDDDCVFFWKGETTLRVKVTNHGGTRAGDIRVFTECPTPWYHHLEYGEGLLSPMGTDHTTFAVSGGHWTYLPVVTLEPPGHRTLRNDDWLVCIFPGRSSEDGSELASRPAENRLFDVCLRLEWQGPTKWAMLKVDLSGDAPTARLEPYYRESGGL